MYPFKCQFTRLILTHSYTGDILAALERANRLGLNNTSMYHSTNLASASVRAAQAKSYWLNSTVVPTAEFLELPRHVLEVCGADYNVTVHVNDMVVGSHVGPYVIARFVLGPGVLGRGPNRVSILFHAPRPELLAAWFGPGNSGQHVMWDYLDFWRSMVGIGYDFAQNVWTIGIQESIKMIATRGCTITSVTVLPSLAPPYLKATLNASFEASCDDRYHLDNMTAVWTVYALDSAHKRLGLQVATRRTRISAKNATRRPGEHVSLRASDVITVNRPRLWWPRGYGDQPMYILGLTLHEASTWATNSLGDKTEVNVNNDPDAVLGAIVDSANRTFGIRDLRQVRNVGPSNWTYIEEFDCGPRGSGGGFNCSFPRTLETAGETAEEIAANRNWTLQVNGRRVFAHGANWLPCDMRISECTDSDYAYLIRAAAEANMNFLRVWGGGGIEKEAFYATCDREGVMVYQETVHSQSMPTRDVNLAAEEIEVAEMIRKLSSHPSIVRYGWGNEYYGVNHTSNRFERQYEDVARSLDPTRWATHGSPVTWADRHGPYCFYLSVTGSGRASFPCWQSPAYEAYNSALSNVMNQEGPNDPFEWDEYVSVLFPTLNIRLLGSWFVRLVALGLLGHKRVVE